jgi:NAD(P)H-hydrate epimerase
MEPISVREMRELEEKAFSGGTSVLELMERAGKECARLIESRLGKGKKIIVFCGPGNNGGDGFVCARYLAEANDVSLVVPIEPKTEEARANHHRAEDAGIRTVKLDEAHGEKADVVVDALLGVGAMGALRGLVKGSCSMINSMKGFKVSIDVPTGMDADTGGRDPDAVRPDATICIHAPKKGVGKAAGELWIADIGL